MEEKEYLNEERYQKNRKKIASVALIVLIIGLLIGASLIAIGLKKQGEINSKYSDESKLNISNQLAEEKQNLETKKSYLESKGITYDSFAKYTDGEVYDLKIITDILDPSFNYYRFDEYKNNSLTSKYCSLKEQLEEVNSEFNKRFHSSDNIQFYAAGGFIIVASCMIAGSIFMFAKRREITAFTAQQVMPVTQEYIEKMTPIAQETIEKMAPSVGKVAKEIAKNIKEGINDEKK